MTLPENVISGMFQEHLAALSKITQGYKTTRQAARSSVSKMSNLMAKEQDKLEKTRTQELDLAQQENPLLRRQLSWYGAPSLPERKDESPDEDCRSPKMEITQSQSQTSAKKMWMSQMTALSPQSMRGTPCVCLHSVLPGKGQNPIQHGFKW